MLAKLKFDIVGDREFISCCIRKLYSHSSRTDQTKLGNSSILHSRSGSKYFWRTIWHPKDAKTIVQKVMLQLLVMPPVRLVNWFSKTVLEVQVFLKISDCSDKDPANCEVFRRGRFGG